MKEVSISFNLYCKWDIIPPVYRIYVDGDLLTERTYIWKNTEQYVKENILVSLEPGIHSLDVIHLNSGFNKFKFYNLKINDAPVALTNNQFTIH